MVVAPKDLDGVMGKKQKRGSLFSQKIDRVAFITYFLGAVVPLVALGVVAEHYVLPNMSDRNAILGLMGVIGSIGVLSLASFLILRHMTRTTAQHAAQRLGQAGRRSARDGRDEYLRPQRHRAHRICDGLRLLARAG